MSPGAGDAQDRARDPRLPGARQRLRCSGCGNLTRFDVTRTRRTREYWHVGLGGEPAVDDVTPLNERVEQIACRWCGRSDAIEVVTRMDVDPTTDPAGAESP
ncbi:MAG: hypothetical protein M3419_03645 [Actinomycetota bacterium]|nr:hypothetical protein [Actinomycetota bacterium]